MSGGLDFELARNFATALLIGALAGIDREKKKSLEGDVGIGGIRTFILFAQAGAVSAWLSQVLGSPWIFAATVGAVSAVVIAGYVVHARAKPNAFGLTTEIAAVGVCLLGGACVVGHPGVAVALGIVTSAALAAKQPLHRLVAKLGTDDIYAGLKLLVATFIVLPLLPDRPLDPWGALNPYELWWLVILISSLSLVGYVTVRWLGRERGTLVTGLAGGLASSTAVTLSFARRSRDEGGARLAGALAAGILIAWGVMFIRVVVLVAVIHAPLVPRVLVPFTAMGLVTLLLSALLLARKGVGPASSEASQDVPLKNPFSLTAAIRFGLFFAAVLLVVKIVQDSFPGRGLLGVAALAGLTDVDAIVLSMARLARAGSDPATAASAITVAALSNTVVKAGLAATLGGPALGRKAVLATALILVAGGLSLLVQ
jgi:uncharacterized membrane protein (DUF4010 family)